MVTDLYDTGKVNSFSATGAEQLQFQEELHLQNLRLLWVVNLDPSVGESHGAAMRFLNFARELTAAGGLIYFSANVFPGDDRDGLQQFLTRLEADGIIAGHVITEYGYTPRQGRFGALAIYPSFTNWMLRRLQRQPVAALQTFIQQQSITSAIVSDRRLFFLGDALRNVVPTLLDWTDSMALHYWRALVARLRARKWGGLFGFIRDYQSNVLSEFHYGRRAALNATVSPVDKLWLDHTNFCKSRNRVWMNGTKTEITAEVEKIPKRLIFSGAMDYAPNCEGALWFIEEVFPLILAKHPDARFVVAGVNPVPELMAKASERVLITGFVPDLGAEIARSSLYVSPLLSGGGFRNKVIESIMMGTYLVGTPMSVEFLPLEFRELLSVADTPQSMADAVIAHLDHPAACREKLGQLRGIVVKEFSWRARSRDLMRFLSEAEANFVKRRGGKR